MDSEVTKDTPADKSINETLKVPEEESKSEPENMGNNPKIAQRTKSLTQPDDVGQSSRDVESIKEEEKPLLASIGETLDFAKSTDPTRSFAQDTGVPDQPRPSLPESIKVQKTVLEDHGFRVGKQIGSGTYAKVKIAYSSEYKGPVAIKIISKVKAPEEYLQKFLPREIEVVKGLKHENLIKFYQSIETTHRVYIIMQLAENGSLLDLIRSRGHLSETRARNFFRQLTSAIEYCHNQGVVHRDIKCENLLLDRDFNLKVIDFGFARRNMKSATGPILSETYCGSYAYASPEVLKGVPYDPHMSDIWAVGVVLFAMVYGRLPFEGTNYNHLLKQVQAKLIFPKNPVVSVTCKGLLVRILAPLKLRYKFPQIKQDPWTKLEVFLQEDED